MNSWEDAIVITSVGVAGVAGLGPLVGRSLRARRWPHTTGTVVRVDAKGGDVRYRYRVGGRTYHAERVTFFGSQGTTFRRGEAIAVRYDPSNPQQAVLDPVVPWGVYLALWLMLLFAAGGALPMLHALLTR